MTAGIETEVKEIIWAKMRERLGEDAIARQAGFLEAQWEWAVELGMIDQEMGQLPQTQGP